MCGIVGFSGKRHANPDKLALLMLHNSLKRGEDNTGIYSLETGIVKTDTKAEVFLGERDLPATSLFIGHVRKASVGSKTAICAHPYEFDNIVLAHNGTLTNHYSMCTNAGYKSQDFETDSHILTKLLDDDSKQEKQVYNTLSEYTGAAALLFTDKRNPEILYAYRNADRPLFFGFINGSMYISSMEENLKVIGARDTKEFGPSYLHTIKHGKIIHSMFYKQKVVMNTYYNQNNNSYAGVTNYREKTAAQSKLEIIFSSARQVAHVSTITLLNRWVQAELDVKGKYGLSPVVNINRDKWYFVEDVATDNDYDLQLKDDSNNYVWANKFSFNIKNINYPTNYGVAMMQLFDAEDDKTLMFNEGSIVELAPNSLISKDDSISCLSGDQIVEIDVSHIRPALQSEVDDYLKTKVTTINNKINNDCGSEDDDTPPWTEDPYAHLNKQLSQQLQFPMAPCNAGRSGNNRPYNYDSIKESLDKVEKEELDETPEDVIAEDVSAEEMTTVQDTEVVALDTDDAENVVTFVLDKIDNIADDLCEMSQTLSWQELSTKTAELKDLINESYNIENVRHHMENS